MAVAAAVVKARSSSNRPIEFLRNLVDSRWQTSRLGIPISLNYTGKGAIVDFVPRRETIRPTAASMKENHPKSLGAVGCNDKEK